ncbi:hypothetical protein ACJMPF_003508 [Salmonella enterica subsp. enterica serovar Newport]|nr:hypothetical protein [Salmonella enterica subsp. enterica serovar Newport]
MGISIYYSAERTHQLSEKENEEVQSIIKKHNEAFPYKDIAETLYIYEDIEPKYILDGSTKLNIDNEEMLLESIDYWLNALTELTLFLPDAVWSVNIDDNNANWVNEHWEM